MPMHNWTRVPAGVFHAFHNTWIGDLQKALNNSLLPNDYYALGEQQAGDIGPDVLTLQTHQDRSEDTRCAGTDSVPDIEAGSKDRSIVLAEAPPKVSLTQEASDDIYFYLTRQRTIVIRHVSGDRVVAILEIISPANKRSRSQLDDFVDKVAAALRDGIHVMIIDTLPPGRCDPNGIHGAIWSRLLAGDFEAPSDKPLTLVSYAVSSTIKAFVEPMSVGMALIDMPLFISPTRYVPVPLEETYDRAWSGVPQRWRNVIEGNA